MKRYTSNELFEEFYETIASKKYPNISKAMIKEMVNIPFLVCNDSMSYDDYPNIRLKYLGTFVVTKRKEYLGKRWQEKRKKEIEEFNTAYEERKNNNK